MQNILPTAGAGPRSGGARAPVALTVAVVLTVAAAGCGQKGPLLPAPGVVIGPSAPTPAAALPPGAQSPASESSRAAERDAGRVSP